MRRTILATGLALLQCGALAAAGSAGADATLQKLHASLLARDPAAYLDLWAFASPADRAAEESFLRSRLSGEELTVQLQPAREDDSPDRARAAAEVFSIAEPRGRLEGWEYTLERRGPAWSIVRRETRPQLEGLVHLSLDPVGLKADGLVLRLEDFELTVREGTVYLPPRNVGPTALTLVGTATVRFRPRPTAEQDQMRQWTKSPELVDTVRAAFVRLHPADLRKVLSFTPSEPDPRSASRLAAATRMFRAHATDAFVLDTTLPRSPWWLLPPLGDAAVAMDTARHGRMAFVVSRSHPEGISLMDRTRRRQISMYPPGGRDTDYDEDAGRIFDVVHHDLSVKIEPERHLLEGESVLKVRLLERSATIQLALDDAFEVLSVDSAEAGPHVFFRVRNQHRVLVSLGPSSGSSSITLRVRYRGTRSPSLLEDEVLQVADGDRTGSMDPPPETEVALDDVLVYSNRLAWYPQAGDNDYATATLRADVPRGWSAVTGGRMVGSRDQGARRIQEFNLDQPGKYMSLAVGRFAPTGVRELEGMTIRGWSVGRLRASADELLDQAAGIARFFSSEFGPAPYPELGFVTFTGRTPGGHSPPGMVLLAQRPAMLRGRLRDDPASLHHIPGFFLAHEMAHQWWGQGVTGQNYRERWLSEGMAQYAAAAWVRETQGEDAFRRVLEHMGRWARAMSPEGPIHLGQRLGHLDGNPQVFRAIAYNKGAYVLHMLRGVIGADAFRDALRTVQRENRFGKIGTRDLQAALEKASGRALAPYFDAWVYGTDLPELRWSQATEAVAGGVRTTVTVDARHLPAAVPLQVAIDADGRKTLRTVQITPERSVFTIDSRSRPRRVTLNPDLALLARVENKR